MFDWGDGSYEITAKQLEAAAETAVQALGVKPGMTVLDVGCGTGNAALAAARLGANVTGVDPAARLVDVARGRAEAEGLAAVFQVGDATALALPDASFDAAVSVFALIFAPDPAKAASELRRVVRPGGKLVMTSWVPRGAIHEIAGKLMNAAATVEPALKARQAPAWGDPDFVRQVFNGMGALTVTEQSLAFDHASPEAMFAELEAEHPAWRGIARMLSGHSDLWPEVRAGSIQTLRDQNEATTGLRVTSDYLLIELVFA